MSETDTFLDYDLYSFKIFLRLPRDKYGEQAGSGMIYLLKPTDFHNFMLVLELIHKLRR